MSRRTHPVAVLFALSAVLLFGVNTAFAQEQTTTPAPTPTPTTGVDASHVDSPFPQDLVIGLLLVVLIIIVAAVLVVRRGRKGS